MSKLLIIGASILQLPAIKRAKELGHYVAVVDYNPNAVGIKYADEYFNASTIDIEAVCRVSEKFKPDGIMTLATDMPMRSIAVATQKLGLPGISLDTAIKATDKGEMIKTFKVHNVPSPWYYIVADKLELGGLNISFPCIIKPTDNAGSRGVCLVNTRADLEEAFEYSQKESRGGKVIVEEYMVGPEVSVEVMVVDGEPYVLAVTDKLTTGAPHFVEMGHCQQSQLPSHIISQIKEVAKQAVKSIGINCGPAHVEIMVTTEGPKMIELGARMGGDCITTHLVPLSTGIDMIKATIDVCLGQRPDIEPKWDKGSAIRFFDVAPGKITAIDGVDEARKVVGVQEITFTKDIGDEVTEIHSSLDRVGYVIAEANDVEKAICICEDILNIISIENV